MGNHAAFLVKPILYFAVTRNVAVEEAVRIGEITSYQAKFDLSEYPGGLNIYLRKTSGGGRYTFTASR